VKLKARRDGKRWFAHSSLAPPSEEDSGSGAALIGNGGIITDAVGGKGQTDRATASNYTTVLPRY
jgi:hypothetical protein